MKLAAFALLWCSITSAADFTGIWLGQIPRQNGSAQDIAFKFTQTGPQLTGKLYGDYQSTPITEGKVTGDELSFIVIAPEQAGNQINQTRLHFTATLKAGELEVIRERESATNAGNGGVVQFKSNAKQTFHLKRLP